MQSFRLGVRVAAALICCGCVATSMIAKASPAATFQGADAATWSKRLESARAGRRTAFAALVEGGQASVPVLAQLLASPKAPIRKQATSALSRIGPGAIPSVEAYLFHRDARVRLAAVSVLRNLGADAAPALPRVARLLRDKDPGVSMEAARTLAMMGRQAAPASLALARALSDRRPYTRVMAAGALASIGPLAAPACQALIRALGDSEAPVRRCAADALAAIGPDAAAAVEPLIRVVLLDPNRHVRICAIGALGAIGPKAKNALPTLRLARKNPALAAEAAWAVGQIDASEGEPESTASVGAASGGPAAPGTALATQVRPGEWPTLGGSPTRNAVTTAKVATTWDVQRKKGVRWTARLGNLTYGSPTVSGGIVFVGTDNAKPRDRKIRGERGVLMAFRAEDGRFLWQDAAPLKHSGLEHFLLPTTCSAPLVEGERVYYTTAQAQLRCLDTQGFADGENDGPIRDEWSHTKKDADLIWELDLIAVLGVFPHEALSASVVSVGDLLMVCTANGVDEAHTNIPAPRAPSFAGVDKRTGEVVWQVVGPSSRVLHGQWSSPAVVDVNGRTLALFGGGDGWLYALEASSGREVWTFDGNPADAVWRPSGDIGGKIGRNNIIASPVVHDGVVYLAMGQDPMHGLGQGRVYAIDPRGQGDVTRRRVLWTYADVGRTIASPIVHEGLVYIADHSGVVHCLEAKTGERVWTYDVQSRVWGTFLLAGDHLYVGDEDGQITVLQTGRKAKLTAAVELDAPIWTVPAVAHGVLYLTTQDELLAIGGE